MATKLEEARAAVATARQVMADCNEAIGRLKTCQQALQRRAKAGGLRDDPSLQRQIDDTKRSLVYLKQQKVKDWFELQAAERRAAHVEKVAAAICQFLAKEGWGDLVTIPVEPDSEPSKGERCIDAN